MIEPQLRKRFAYVGYELSYLLNVCYNRSIAQHSYVHHATTPVHMEVGAAHVTHADTINLISPHS